jgi:hypothetical protein
MNKKFVDEFVKAASNYGKSVYQYHLSMEEVNRQKSNLKNLQHWLKKTETRKASADARKMLRMDISQTRERLKAETAYSKVLSKRVTRLEQAIAIKTRKLVAE